MCSLQLASSVVKVSSIQTKINGFIFKNEAIHLHFDVHRPNSFYFVVGFFTELFYAPNTKVNYSWT